jgi:membrane associated rhomboid family serine protease
MALRGNVTKILVGINVLVFVVFQNGLSAGFNSQTGNKFTADYEMLGHAQYVDGSIHGVAQGEYYRLITAAFLHANIIHIAFNMFALWQIGTVLERLLGTWRYLALYFVGAIGGNTLSYVVHGASTASVGASTALFAMFGAFYLLVRKVGGDTSQIVSLIVLNLVMTFFLSTIDKFGHIGGLLAGGLVGLIYTRIPSNKPQLQALLCGAVAVGCVVAAVLTTASIT